MISIKYEELFLEKLKTGINIFTGAGFSVLPAPDGNRIPSSEELGKMIIEEFCLDFSEKTSLELISSMAKQKDGRRFDSFLRRVFKVQSHNKLYDAINRVNIKSFITTNIDNLAYNILDDNPEKYLNSALNGRVKDMGKAIEYIALHGDVTDMDSNLYFGAFELSHASADNNRMFELMKGNIIKNPTLFWGYSFQDNSVMNSIGSIMEENKDEIWIQLRGSDKEKIEVYSSLGFNVIVADTRELLSYIGEKIPEHKNRKTIVNQPGDIWNDYNIPSQNKLDKYIEAKDYFREGVMGWNVIFSKYPYQSRYVLEVCNEFLACNNLIVVGTPQSGKTTILRQAAMYLDAHCYYIEELTLGLSKKLVKALENMKTDIIVLVDDCADDMSAFEVLAREKRIHLLGVANEHSYEASKHLLADVSYKTYVMSDLTMDDANKTYGYIPAVIRKDKFSYSKKNNEKYSYWEFCVDNIRDIINENKLKQFLQSIKRKEIREILFLTSYLTNNKSYLSLDVLWYYTNLNNYNEIMNLVREANEVLSTTDEELVADLDDQDYYSLRSHIFYRLMSDVAKREYKKEYGEVIKKLIINVPRGVIARYNIFRRTAYDAGVFFRVFGSGHKSIYDEIYKYDNSAYILQQKALYLSRCKCYDEAFELIDKASLEMPNNFSIQNAKAIITFEANKNSNEPEARKQLEKAMDILSDCYHSDKRKAFHVQKYAEFALYLSKTFNENKYLECAYKWLYIIIQEGDATGKTKKLASLVKEAMVVEG